MDTWVQLKRDQKKVRGEVHVLLALGSSRDVQVACKEHRLLARVMVRNQLQKVESAFAWDGTLSDTAEQILTQHRAHTGISETHALLARWAGHCDHHDDSPFNFNVLEEMLNELLALQAKEDKSFEDHEVRNILGVI